MAHIGFVGLGMMGSAMVRRLLTHGHSVNVWNRTGEKCLPLMEAGATVSRTLEELVSGSRLIMSMISTPDVLEGIAGTIRSHAVTGTLHVDMSTVSPESVQRCAVASAGARQSFVHAPVLGSVPQVDEGSLLIFAGGDAGSVETLRPILGALSSKVYEFPRAEDATRLKLACNFFIASLITTLGQGLRFAGAAGLDGNILLDVLGRSALGAPMFATKGKNILADTFTPRFLLDHMLKDVRLFRRAAEDLGAGAASLPFLEQIFSRASEEGLGDSDYSAVVKML